MYRARWLTDYILHPALKVLVCVSDARMHQCAVSSDDGRAVQPCLSIRCKMRIYLSEVVFGTVIDPNFVWHKD